MTRGTGRAGTMPAAPTLALCALARAADAHGFYPVPSIRSKEMKAEVDTNLSVAEALTTLGAQLAGDLTFETVVDEQFGGVNGTLAGRLMGFNGHAAIIPEPRSLHISPAQRGGRRLFAAWFEGLLTSHPSIFRQRPHLPHPIRWVPGSAIAADSTLVSELAAAVNSTLGFPPVIARIEGRCDMYAFHELGIPFVLWGTRGGNTDMPDEYVVIDSLVQSAKALLAFVCSWCGRNTR